MERWMGKIAVVTGASSGNGFIIAKTLIMRGMRVVGLARRKKQMEERMDAIPGTSGKFFPYGCDISSEDEVIRAFTWIREKLGTVQVLINNAGICVPGGFAETSSQLWRDTVELNVLGTVYCTTQALRAMQEGKVEGHIVNINSVQGHRVHKFGGMDFNIQPATKHAITGLTETLQRELMGQNIRVTSLSPGVVRTEMVEAHGMESLLSEPGLDPQDIADAVVYVVGTPLRVQITELTIRPLGERPV